MIWADLADLAPGPPFRRNAEIRFCNRGLFSSETHKLFLFKQNYAQPLHFYWKNFNSRAASSQFFLNVVNCGYMPWFGQILHLGLNLGVKLKTGSATMAFLVPKQLFSFFSTKTMLCLCLFDGKFSLPERHQANFFLKCGELRIPCHGLGRSGIWASI